MRRSCGTKPMPWRATRKGGQPVMSVPSNTTRPWRGGVSPTMLRRVVVFPTPLRPSRHTPSPSATSRLTPKRIWLSP